MPPLFEMRVNEMEDGMMDGRNGWERGKVKVYCERGPV